MEQSASVRFRIVLTRQQIMRCACSHAHEKQDASYIEPGCRPCQINQALTNSAITISWENDETNFCRILFGTAENDAQKIALTRLIAISRGDMEPLDLVDARSAGFRV